MGNDLGSCVLHSNVGEGVVGISLAAVAVSQACSEHKRGEDLVGSKLGLGHFPGRQPLLLLGELGVVLRADEKSWFDDSLEAVGGCEKSKVRRFVPA